jgi:hypothetical protein
MQLRCLSSSDGERNSRWFEFVRGHGTPRRGAQNRYCLSALICMLNEVGTIPHRGDVCRIDKKNGFSVVYQLLHNAVVAWNSYISDPSWERLRPEEHTIDDTTLSLTTPLLLRKHFNPFGKYHFDLERMRQTADLPPAETS